MTAPTENIGAHAALIDRYQAGAQRLSRALEGLAAPKLDAQPGPGAFTIRQLTAHCLDADFAYADRIKRIIAMDRPTLLGWDQNAFASNLAYEKLDADLALDVFVKNRQLIAAILRTAPPGAWARIGELRDRHSAFGALDSSGATTTVGAADGEVTLQRIVTIACDHLEHHMRFLSAKRERLGLPLPNQS